MRGMYDLRDENGERKYSQRDLAKHFGTSQSYVCLINRDNPETEEKILNLKQNIKIILLDKKLIQRQERNLNLKQNIKIIQLDK